MVVERWGGGGGLYVSSRYGCGVLVVVALSEYFGGHVV
jgi:hypothetical protein